LKLAWFCKSPFVGTADRYRELQKLLRDSWNVQSPFDDQNLCADVQEKIRRRCLEEDFRRARLIPTVWENFSWQGAERVRA